MAVSNQFGTNILSGTNLVNTQLASTLTVLQNNILQALGLIAAFNANQPDPNGALEFKVQRSRFNVQGFLAGSRHAATSNLATLNIEL